MAAGAVQGAKAAGDLNPGFHETEVALGFVVSEWQLPGPQEGEDEIVIGLEAIQEVLLLGLFAALARHLLGAQRVDLASGSQDLVVAFLPSPIFGLAHGRRAGPLFLDIAEHLQEQVVKVFGPGLMVLFEDENQLPHQMAFAEGMEAVFKAQIAGEKVMHQPAGELGDDADGVDGLFAAARLDAEEGQQGRANHMQPVFDLVDRKAGFIHVEHRLLGQDLFQALFKGLQGLVLLLAGALHGAFADGIAEHFLAHLADAQTGSQLGVVEVGQQRAKVLPILNRGFDLLGKRSRHDLVTAGAFFDFGAMFGALQLEGRQVEDLAAFKVHDRLFGEILAALALLQGMNLDVLGMVAEREGAPGVARLAARFAAGLLAQAFGLRLLRPVSRRGPRTIAATLSRNIPQPAHLGLEFESVMDQRVGVGLHPMAQLL